MLPQQAAAGTLHVPGEFPKIQDAVDAADPGDTVLVRSRNRAYKENVTVNTNRITIKGDTRDPNRYPIVDGFDGGGIGTPAIDVTANKFTAQYLKIANSSGIDCTGDDCTILDSRFRGKNQSDCVEIDGARGTVMRSEFKGCDSHAVEIDGRKGTIVGNIAKLADSDCFHVDGKGLRFERNKALFCEDGSALELDNGDESVVRNSVGRNVDNDVLELEGKGMLVEKNRVRDTDDDCIDVDGRRSIVRSNDATACEQLEVSGKNLRVKNNTVAFSRDSSDCVYVDGDNAIVKGNSLYACSYSGMEVGGENPVVVDNVIQRIAADDGLQVYCQDNGSGNDSCKDGLVQGNSVRRSGDDDQSIYVSAPDGVPGLKILDNYAKNGFQEGLDVSMSGGVVARNYVRNMASEEEPGIDIYGDDNEIRNNVAKNNSGEGIIVAGARNLVKNNVALVNGIDGIRIENYGPVTVDDNVLIGNYAARNRAEGIENEATDTVIRRSISLDNLKVDCADEGTIAKKSNNSCADGSNFKKPGKLDRPLGKPRR